MDPLLAAALETLGIADRPRPLTSHHTHAWRAGGWRIKTAEGPADAVSLHHEARALTILREQGLYPVGGTHGHVGDGVWTAVEWRQGVTLWRWCESARRTGPGPADRLPALARRAFAALARLHAVGWHHGDIQPMNILVTPGDGIEFIDHDLTHHRDLLPLPLPYRGGMDLTTAPEVARQLLDTGPGHHVSLTDAAEVYSLGASFRAAWTGSAPATDRAIGGRIGAADILEDIATGRHRPPLAAVRPWPDPDLEALLEATMSLDPRDRAAVSPAAPYRC
ncbi:phosphotransferase [Embleya sp. NPDC008237]|uniref:phosphotransferase n=1 Tax=Embleya sp. NPDC008237 TaxID=3363978 RepID=UPI0036E42034